jgi:hypothetical protein
VGAESAQLKRPLSHTEATAALLPLHPPRPIWGHLGEDQGLDNRMPDRVAPIHDDLVALKATIELLEQNIAIESPNPEGAEPFTVRTLDDLRRMVAARSGVDPEDCRIWLPELECCEIRIACSNP